MQDEKAVGKGTEREREGDRGEGRGIERERELGRRRVQYEAERFNDAYDIFALSKWAAFGAGKRRRR